MKYLRGLEPFYLDISKIRASRYLDPLFEFQKGMIEHRKEIENSHKNCCDSCKKIALYNFDLLANYKFHQFRKELDRDYKYSKKKLSNCQDCGIDYNLHVHHIDGDRTNDNEDNLMTLCGNCHKKIHKSRSKK